MPAVHTQSGKRMKATIREGTNQLIRQTMVTVAGDDILLLETVAGGRDEFRRTFVAEFAPHFAVDETIANGIFNFFCLKVADKWPGQTAGQVLDSITELVSVRPKIPTEAEIDAGWEFESSSSVAGKEFFYRDMTGPPIVVSDTALAAITHELQGAATPCP